MEIARDAIGLPPGRYRLDAALKELSFGVWEGLDLAGNRGARPQGHHGAQERQVELRAARRRELRDARRAPASWLDELTGDAFVVSHGGVARALMTLIAGVAPAKAADAPIAQGRALCFENGSCHWIM